MHDAWLQVIHTTCRCGIAAAKVLHAPPPTPPHPTKHAVNRYQAVICNHTCVQGAAGTCCCYFAKDAKPCIKLVSAAVYTDPPVLATAGAATQSSSASSHNCRTSHNCQPTNPSCICNHQQPLANGQVGWRAHPA